MPRPKSPNIERLGGKSLIITIGEPMLLEPAGMGRRFKTAFIGMERGRYIIVRVPRIAGVSEYLYVEKPITVRYMHEGQVYGFSSEIIYMATSPFRLAFLRFPDTIEAVNLRESKRIDCYLPARVMLAEGSHEQLTSYPAMITNISSGGCQAVIEAEEARLLPPISMDQPVTMTFTMFGRDEEEELPGKVKNIAVSGTRQYLGVMFDNVSESIRNHIHEYIQSVTDYLGA
jgi:c-di-GMP-binding flagellar brake protein YcgR